MNESAVLAVLRFVDAYLPAPGWSWPVRRFDERSYERWAADEIVGRLADRPFSDYEDVVEIFAIEMAYFSRWKEEPGQSDIFRIAQETATRILEYLKGVLP